MDIRTLIAGDYMRMALPLVLAYVLDLLLGDPRRLPHPVRLFGWLISLGDRSLNRGSGRVLKGAILAFFLSAAVFSGLWAIEGFLLHLPFLRFFYGLLMLFWGLANRSLITEVLKVERLIEKEKIPEARRQLSMIVGRDTASLDSQGMRRALVETLSENLSDGVIAPLFYYALGGIPAMFSYKMVNTMDSMLGYKNERYRNFGRVAARLDDLLNLLPARLTALQMVLVSGSARGLRFVFRYGNKHSSPNAGYPEAAIAGILNCRLGGPSSYGGKRVDKPFIGDHARKLQGSDIRRACRVNLLTSLSMLLLILLIYYLFL